MKRIFNSPTRKNKSTRGSKRPVGNNKKLGSASTNKEDGLDLNPSSIDHIPNKNSDDNDVGVKNKEDAPTTELQQQVLVPDSNSNRNNPTHQESRTKSNSTPLKPGNNTKKPKQKVKEVKPQPSDDDRQIVQKRKLALMYLDRYEQMVGAQEQEDKATILHLKAIFHIIQTLGTEQKQEQKFRNDGNSKQDESEYYKEEPSFMTSHDYDFDVNVTQTNQIDSSYSKVQESGKKTNDTNLMGDMSDQEHDALNQTYKLEKKISSSVNIEVVEIDNDAAVEASFCIDDLNDNEEDFDSQVNEKEQKEPIDSTEKSSLKISDEYHIDEPKRTEKDQNNVIDEADTSFTIPHEQTFTRTEQRDDLGSTKELLAKMTTKDFNTCDTSFTIPHEQTFMKDSNLSRKESGEISQKFVKTHELMPVENHPHLKNSIYGVEYNECKIDESMFTQSLSFINFNEQDTFLTFDAIAFFVKEVKEINKRDERLKASNTSIITSTPEVESYYHILQTDAQLMLILSTISDIVEENGNLVRQHNSTELIQGGNKEDEDMKDGLSFAEFVHVYKSVIAGMQTLQMVPGPSSSTTEETDMEHTLGPVREMTRERTLHMIRTFTVRSISELETLIANQNEPKQKNKSYNAETFEDDIGERDSPKVIALEVEMQQIMSKHKKELSQLSARVKQLEHMKKQMHQRRRSILLLILFAFVFGFGIGYQYVSFHSDKNARSKDEKFRGELLFAEERIESLELQLKQMSDLVDERNDEIKEKNDALSQCTKMFNTIGDKHSMEIKELQLELDECNERIRHHAIDCNIQDTKSAIKRNQSLQKIIVRRQVMTAVGTAMIAAVPSILKFLFKVIIF